MSVLLGLTKYQSYKVAGAGPSVYDRGIYRDVDVGASHSFSTLNQRKVRTVIFKNNEESERFLQKGLLCLELQPPASLHLKLLLHWLSAEILSLQGSLVPV